MAPTLKTKSEEDFGNRIPSSDELVNRQRQSVQENLLKCLNAPKRKPTLENGFIHDNIDLFRKLKSENGRKRYLSDYFSKKKY